MQKFFSVKGPKQKISSPLEYGSQNILVNPLELVVIISWIILPISYIEAWSRIVLNALHTLFQYISDCCWFWVAFSSKQEPKQYWRHNRASNSRLESCEETCSEKGEHNILRLCIFSICGNNPHEISHMNKTIPHLVPPQEGSNLIFLSFVSAVA